MSQKAPQTGPVDPSDELAVETPRATEGRTDVSDVNTEAVDTQEDGKNGPTEIRKGVDAQQKAVRSNEGHRLDAAQEKSLLLKLVARFKKETFLHEGVEWARVKASLKADPEALWSINELEKAGHEPDVYNADKEGFDIGTCIKECSNIPRKGAKACVYSDDDAQMYKEKYKFEPESAIGMAKSMGTELMDPVLYYENLLKKGDFDIEAVSWLATPTHIRNKGKAMCGFNTKEEMVLPRGRLVTILPDGSLSAEDEVKYDQFNGSGTVYDSVSVPGSVVVTHIGPRYNPRDYERRVPPGPVLTNDNTDWHSDSLYWRGTKRVKWAA